jgi:large subunit ribosomal protein L4
MELKLIDSQGKSSSTMAASDQLFAREFNEALVHQVVVAYQANARQGTRAQKERSQVNKSTKKPWRQKGTGRARAGRASSPLWRGGGKVFASQTDENFTQKVNRKMYRAGVAAILSQLAREDRLCVVDAFTVESPKTRMLADKVKGMGFDDVLIVTDQLDENLFLSSRNLPYVGVLRVEQTDPLSLLQFDKVLFTRNAIARLEEILK